MYFFYSGVSVNVQDLAPSCAGALFGELKKKTTQNFWKRFIKFSWIWNILALTWQIFFLKHRWNFNVYLHFFYRCYEYMWCFLRWVSVISFSVMNLSPAVAKSPFFTFNSLLSEIIHPLLWIQTLSWRVSRQSCWLLCAMHISSRERDGVCVGWIIQGTEDDS